MSGRVGDLSKRQVARLAQLKASLTDIWRDEFESDVYLLRWLRSRNFEVRATGDMIRASLQWRIDEDIDAKLSNYTPPEVIRKYYPGGYLGRDKEGYPIFIFPYGHVDPRQLFRAATFKEINFYRIRNFEHIFRVLIPEAARAANKPIDGFTVIFDLEKFGMKNLWRPAMREFNMGTRVIEANYPELMYRIIIINNPKIFNIAYSMVKPFMSATTEKKICFLGSNYQQELLKIVDAKELPKCYGGMLIDSNGFGDCREWICWGGDIPESYFLRMIKTADVVQTVVENGSRLCLHFKADKPSQILLQWEFETEEYDIKFGVFRRLSSEEVPNMKLSPATTTSPGTAGSANTNSGCGPQSNIIPLLPIVPMERLTSHLTAIKGEVVLRESGNYIVMFDNTYSWTRSKRLTYKIEELRCYTEADRVLSENCSSMFSY